MTGKERFHDGLVKLGYKVEDHGHNRLSFQYVIKKGRFEGTSVQLGFEVPEDFDLNPPHGPHMLPRLLPVDMNSNDPTIRMHTSGFGPKWGHLSRPFPNWNNTRRSVKEYMRWALHVLETL